MPPGAKQRTCTKRSGGHGLCADGRSASLTNIDGKAGHRSPVDRQNDSPPGGGRDGCTPPGGRRCKRRDRSKNDRLTTTEKPSPPRRSNLPKPLSIRARGLSVLKLRRCAAAVAETGIFRPDRIGGIRRRHGWQGAGRKMPVSDAGHDASAHRGSGSPCPTRAKRREGRTRMRPRRQGTSGAKK